MMMAEYRPAGSAWRRWVVIDPDAATVSFGNCHFPKRFFAWGTDAEYTCRISELRGVCWNMGGTGTRWRREPTLEVVTPAGRAMLPKAATGFDAVYEALVAGIPEGVRLRWYQYPAVQPLVGLLILPGGIAITMLCAVLLEHRWISAGLLAGVCIVLMPLVFVRVLSFWLGKPLVP